MTTNSCRPLFATLTGIALAAAASHGSAAPPRDGEAATGAPSQVASLQSPRAEAGARRATAPLVLHLEDPGGNAVRLIHVPGVGWEYERAARGSNRQVKMAPLQATAAASAGTSGDDVPLTVFIDGPSGFTYVWNRDDGWTCIGRLVDDTL